MSHPPHLMSSWSSAFVPFCAYKTSLNFSKESYALEGTDFPLCSSFLPTILEGQLCYKLDLKKVSGNGKENELMLLLDYNEERSLQISSNKSITTKTSNETLNFGTAVDNIQGSSVKIVINTLSSFTGFGGGVFKMTDVKRMTAKEDFLKMPFKDKRCEVELYEDCRTRKLLEECNCVPWELSRFQVGFFLFVVDISSNLQNMAICDAKGRDCIEENSSKTFNCNTTCVGIYADVLWEGKNIEEELKDDKVYETIQTTLKGKVDDDLLQILLLLKSEQQLMKNDIEEKIKIASGQRGEELDRKKYKMLISEYRKFKEKNMKHFRFNSATNLSTFGKLNNAQCPKK